MTRTAFSVLRIHLALFSVSAIFGINSVTSKYALREIDPLALVFIRIITAAIILFILHRWTVGEKIQNAGDYARLALYSLFGIVINQTLFLKGLSMTTAINATVLVTTIPVTTILIAMILKKESFNVVKFLGTLVSLTGVILLMGSERIDLSDQYFIGNALIFLNGVSYSVFLVISKDILKRYSPLTVTTWTFVFGAFGIMPFSAAEAVTFDYSAISAWAWACIGFLIIFASVLVYYINSWALKRTSSSMVAVYIYVQPVMASLIAGIVLDETLTAHTLLSAGLIFIGVMVVSWQSQREKKKDIDFLRESAAHLED